MARDLTSIIILTWNALKYTKTCLDSLFRYTPQSHELIIVDNGSADGTVEYLKQLGHARCIFNKGNRGFAGGVNQGFRAARGKFLLLLNNDTILTPNWLRNMLICLQSNHRIGLVGPRSNYVGGLQGKMGKLPVANREEMMAFAASFNARSNPAKWFPVPSLSGFCLLMKRQVVNKVGYFDERFKLGTREDRDYCLRAGQKGFQLVCAGDTFVFHFGHRTFRANKLDEGRVRSVNMELFKQKWGGRE